MSDRLDAVVGTSEEQAADLFAAYATGVAFRVELSMPQIRALRRMRDSMHRDPEHNGKMERFDGGYGISTTRALMNKGLATFRNRKHVPTAAGIAVLTLVDMARIHSSSNAAGQGREAYPAPAGSGND